MPAPDDDLIQSPPAPPAAEESTEERRGRGRPTLAEIEAKKAELAEREEALRQREAEIELAAAEANLAMREAQVAARQVSAGRSNGLRAGTLRSEDVTAPVRGRRFKNRDNAPGKFDIDMADIPDGMSYQWNNYTVFGKADPSMDAFMQMQGWEPVMADRHPHLMPPGYKGPIIVDGQILVERPKELTNEALQEELDRARGEVRAKEDQLYGARPDTPVGRSLGIKKDFERPTAELPRGATYQYETPGQGGGIAID